MHFKDVFPQKVAGAQLSYCCRVFLLLTTMLVGFYSTVPFHSIKVVIFYGEDSGIEIPQASIATIKEYNEK